MIKQALISVSDKTGVLEFARALTAMKVKLLSTGGTAKLLADHGLEVTEVADYTGFPEMLDGRVKTLHPKIHGGILARRDFPAHREALDQHQIPTIDMVVVNLYPFQQTIAKEQCSLEDAIENIDIGGPAMLRSSAKNHKDVVVICDPSDYVKVLDEMRAAHGEVIDDAIDRQRANIAAGKEKRRNDEAVGAHSQTTGGRRKNCLIVAGRKKIVGEGGIKNFVHKLR